MTQRFISAFHPYCWTPFRIGNVPEVYDEDDKDRSFVGWIRPKDKVDGKFYSTEIEAGPASIRVWIDNPFLEHFLNYLEFAEMRSHSVAKFPYNNEDGYFSKWESFARTYHAERFAQ